MPSRRPPTGVEPGSDTPPDVPGPEPVASEPEDVAADVSVVTSTGAIPYDIDGRRVSHHEYAEWANEQARLQAIADLQAAAEGRGEPTEDDE